MKGKMRDFKPLLFSRLTTNTAARPAIFCLVAKLSVNNSICCYRLYYIICTAYLSILLPTIGKCNMLTLGFYLVYLETLFFVVRNIDF